WLTGWSLYVTIHQLLYCIMVGATPLVLLLWVVLPLHELYHHRIAAFSRPVTGGTTTLGTNGGARFVVATRQVVRPTHYSSRGSVASGYSDVDSQPSPLPVTAAAQGSTAVRGAVSVAVASPSGGPGPPLSPRGMGFATPVVHPSVAVAVGSPVAAVAPQAQW